jgi:lauroyl/myristoyl acyltransferase
MPAVAGIRLVMEVLVRMTAADDFALRLRGIEVKNFRFLMIDPHQGVIVATAHAMNLDSVGCAASSTTIARWPIRKVA